MEQKKPQVISLKPKDNTFEKRLNQNMTTELKRDQKLSPNVYVNVKSNSKLSKRSEDLKYKASNKNEDSVQGHLSS